jgi:flavin-dependent dehydrogenase
MMLRHAGKCGAKIFEGVRVNSVDFASENGHANGILGSDTKPNPGRPVSAFYTWKADGTTGVIKFDYIVDASGRNGLLNTKYLKNRTYNQGLKNIANWAYYKGCDRYGEGTPRQNAPFFEALRGMLGCLP